MSLIRSFINSFNKKENTKKQRINTATKLIAVANICPVTTHTDIEESAAAMRLAVRAINCGLLLFTPQIYNLHL